MGTIERAETGVDKDAFRSITVGLIAAQVADQSGVTNREALSITRQVVGRYARLPATDEIIQEIALQSLFEARQDRAHKDAALFPASQAMPALIHARR